MRPDQNDSEAILAYDNAVSASKGISSIEYVLWRPDANFRASAVSKLIANAKTLAISRTDLLPLWLESMPVTEDDEEMEPTLSLLLDTIAYDDPSVSPENDVTRTQVLRIFAQSLDNPKMVARYSMPLTTVLPHYLSRCPVDNQKEWNAKVSRISNVDSTADE